MLGNLAGALEWQHTSLVVDDVDLALDFYSSNFGYSRILEVRGMAEPIQSMLGLKEVTCDLIQAVSPIQEHVLEFIAFHNVPDGADERLPIWAGHCHVAFVVKDIAEALAAVKANGGVPIGEVTRFPDSLAVYCWDPAGTIFELEQRTDAAPS
jgi:predicted enzyme related to lactoylglutathione lyase